MPLISNGPMPTCFFQLAHLRYLSGSELFIEVNPSMSTAAAPSSVAGIDDLPFDESQTE